jgi:hypothetical protein
MTHDQPDPEYSDSTTSYRDKPMHPVRAELYALAVKACDKFGGAANVDGTYWFVDTKRYTLVPNDD